MTYEHDAAEMVRILLYYIRIKRGVNPDELVIIRTVPGLWILYLNTILLLIFTGPFNSIR